MAEERTTKPKTGESEGEDREVAEGEPDDELVGDLPEPRDPLARRDEAEAGAEGDADGDDEAHLPGQMGHRRYVYAVYFALGIALAYFISKAGLALWHRLSQWTPKVGEPREDLMTPIGAAISALIVWLVYRRPDVRTLSDEVALELSKVEWPTRDAVRRSTTIVVLATLGSSLTFWLYDIGANHAIGFIADSPKTWVVLLRVGLGGLAIWVVRAIGLRVLAGQTERAS
ncbi:MAG: hypothetical protein NVS3B10_23500 [Polyangiales bacterium]